MARPTSMTRKLVTALTSVVAISWLLACGLGVMAMQDEFAEIFDAGLEETSERLLPLLLDDLRENNTAPAAQKLNQSAEGAEYLTYQVRDREGQVVLHSHDSSTEPSKSGLIPVFPRRRRSASSRSLRPTAIISCRWPMPSPIVARRS